MAYVFHIAFDNTRRLKRRVYYFRYKNRLFKLIQNNPRKHSDVLLTIIPTAQSDEEQEAYLTASEFLSALSWENNSQIAMRHGGGYGATDNLSLRSARCAIFDLPQLPTYYSRMGGYSIDRLPKIQTMEQRTALTLFRDGLSSNHTYLSFLLFWQVLEVMNEDPSRIATDIYNSSRQRLHVDHFADQLNLRGKTFGDYLREDCRNAIAHIQREPGRTSIKPDNAEDNRRILISTNVIREIARHYIRYKLDIGDNVYLVRYRRITYPLYADNSYIRTNSCRMAY